VRLFDSVLRRMKNPTKPQQKFLCHVMRVLLLRPGRMTCRTLRRYRPDHERTFARGVARAFACVPRKHAAIVEVVPQSHEHLLAFDPSCVPKSGQHTYGLERCWNGAHSRAAKGLELATRAWGDVTHNSASPLRVEPTSPAPHREAEEPRSANDLAHLARVVTPHSLQTLKSLAGEGYGSKKKFVDGLCAGDWPVIGKLRRDAPRRHLDSGPRGAGPGRPPTYAGKVAVSERSRCEQGDADDADMARYAPVVHHPQFQRHLPLVGVRHRPTGRDAVLFSTEVSRSAQPISRYYQARFQIEWLFRAAKQCTGLRDGQARSASKGRLHWHASLRAVSFAKLEARQSSDRPQAPFSMASLQRRYFHPHLVDRILDQCAIEGR
jgi:hypothetical protein